MEGEWTGYDGGAVQDWHRNASHIRVASGVTVIPPRAFENCEDLRVVDLNDVTTISARAFLRCHSLEHIIWATTVSSAEIGECAFYGCKRLERIDLSSTTKIEVGESAFEFCRKLEEIDLSNATKIGVGAFMCCNALTRVTIPSSIIEIGPGAFAFCENLLELELGEGIQRVRGSAFHGCGALVRITIPASVIYVDANAFCDCSELTVVALNEGLQNIGEKAFYRCEKLFRISIPSTVLTVEHNAFAQCDQLRYAELHEGNQMIGTETFRDCCSLERITIPSSVTFIGTCAFQYCVNLAEVTLCEGVHFVDEDAFDSNSTLEHINIPPVALVIDIGRSRCQLVRSTMLRTDGGRKKLVVSKWMQYRSPEQLEQAEAKVNEIMSRRHAEGQKRLSIRTWFAYYDLIDVTTMLELAIWKANMDANAQGVDGRQRSRQNCGNGMGVIIPGVLPFLDAYNSLLHYHDAQARGRGI